MFWTCVLEVKIETEIDQILNYFLDLLILVMYITVALWCSVKKVFLNISQFYHETIIRTRVTLKKCLVLCMTQLANKVLLKMLKYFEAMLNIFGFSCIREIVKCWLVYGNKFSESSYILSEKNFTKLVPASCFLWSIITVIISPKILCKI